MKQMVMCQMSRRLIQSKSKFKELFLYSYDIILIIIGIKCLWRIHLLSSLRSRSNFIVFTFKNVIVIMLVDFV